MLSPWSFELSFEIEEEIADGKIDLTPCCGSPWSTGNHPYCMTCGFSVESIWFAPVREKRDYVFWDARKDYRLV